MVAVCHSVVRAPAARVTRLDACGTVLDSACAYAVTESFTEIVLTKVNQDRQDALQLNANGDICVDKPKAPILRWYEVAITFCNVDPELFNIVSAEPLILNDAATPAAVGWCTLPNSPESSNFALEFWTGTEDEGCSGSSVVYGYGVLPRITQGMIGDVTVGNNVVTFTVTGITRGANKWGTGPYNVIIHESGPNVGQADKLLVAMNASAHKCFQWTTLAPPPGQCGCQDLTPTLAVAPLTGTTAVARTATIPLGPDGLPITPGHIFWGDTMSNVVTAGTTTINHTYAAPGNYVATYKPTQFSTPTYTSATIVVS